MRDCPSCDYPFRSVLVAEYNKPSLLKYNLSGPVLSLCQCEMCGMMYVDGGQADQAWFDNYYLKFYKTDDKPYADARLESLAKCIHDTFLFENVPHIFRSVLDIGGTDGELQERLKKWGIIAHPSGVDDGLTSGYSSAVLSHTLEHIYDVQAMMARVQAALVPGGLLFIEVPIWFAFKSGKYVPNFETYDNHWQHINKFRPEDLEKVLKDNGFEIVLSTGIEDYREYNVWRIIGRMG